MFRRCEKYENLKTNLNSKLVSCCFFPFTSHPCLGSEFSSDNWPTRTSGHLSFSPVLISLLKPTRRFLLLSFLSPLQCCSFPLPRLLSPHSTNHLPGSFRSPHSQSKPVQEQQTKNPPSADYMLISHIATQNFIRQLYTRWSMQEWWSGFSIVLNWMKLFFIFFLINL